jgi:hypothetical protein
LIFRKYARHAATGQNPSEFMLLVAAVCLSRAAYAAALERREAALIKRKRAARLLSPPLG